MDDPFATYARFYDLDYAGFDDDLLMVEELAERCGSPLLELGCGTGRLLLPLARRGLTITGVDSSAAMLRIAREKVRAAGMEDRVTLIQQDIRGLCLEGRFTMAFAAINSFMHLLSRDDQLAALSSVRECLVPGGLLLLDLFNPDPAQLQQSSGLVVLDKVMSHPGSGLPIVKFQSHTTDLSRQKIDTLVMLDEMDDEGRVKRTLFAYTMRFLYRAELELLLQQAGLELEAVYGSYDLEEHTTESAKMIAVTRRPSQREPR